MLFKKIKEFFKKSEEQWFEELTEKSYQNLVAEREMERFAALVREVGKENIYKLILLDTKGHPDTLKKIYAELEKAHQR